MVLLDIMKRAQPECNSN